MKVKLCYILAALVGLLIGVMFWGSMFILINFNKLFPKS